MSSQTLGQRGFRGSFENTPRESLRTLEEAKRAGQPLPEQKPVNRTAFPANQHEA